MVMGLSLCRRERDDDDRIERRDLDRVEIPAGIEYESIGAGYERVRRFHERAQPTVGIGISPANDEPLVLSHVPLEHHRHTCGGPSERRIENMSGDRAHAGRDSTL